MNLLAKAFVLTALLVLALGLEPASCRNESPTGTPSAQADESAARNDNDFDQEAERELVRLTNEERRKQGLAPLAVDDRLVRAAREHSRLMADKHLLSHQFPGEPTVVKRLAAAGIRFDRSGENVSLDDTAQGAHVGLMNSPRHRANILSPDYNAVGVGVVRRGSQIWVTQEFVRRLEFHTEDEAENIIARDFAQLRRARGHAPLQRVQLKDLRQLACRMAHQGKLDTRGALGLVGSGYSVAFTASEPGDLPSHVRGMADRTNVSKYAVAACFEASEKYPSGVYWVLMIFY